MLQYFFLLDAKMLLDIVVPIEFVLIAENIIFCLKIMK